MLPLIHNSQWYFYLNMTLGWCNTAFYSSSKRSYWSGGMSIKEWSTDWYGNECKIWIVVIVVTNVWLRMIFYLNTTLGWCNSALYSSWKRSYWSGGMSIKEWSTNWYGTECKIWIVVIVVTYAWLTMVFYLNTTLEWCNSAFYSSWKRSY